MLLAVPSVFDLIATCLMVLGLLHTNASVWMLLRGGGIIFVALMKHFVLHDSLKDLDDHLSPAQHEEIEELKARPDDPNAAERLERLMHEAHMRRIESVIDDRLRKENDVLV